LIGIIFVILIKLIKLTSCFVLIPLIKRYFVPQGLTGPGGHRYITDVKKKLANFSMEELSCLAEAEYDKSVYFKTGGIVSDYKNEKRSLLSFYGDFVCPKEPVSRHNKLLGPLKAITFKDEMEIEVDNNSFKLKYKNKHIATLIASTKRILNSDGKEVGFIENPQSQGGNFLATTDLHYRGITVNGEEIARYAGVFFVNPENKSKFSGKPLFQSIKGGISEFEEQLLILLVVVEIYYNSVYYFEKK